MNQPQLLCCLLAATLTGTTVSMADTIKTNAVAPVQKAIFDNGLTVLVREDHSAPVVTAQAWCRAGSITEGQLMGAGLSHVLEHMLFKGTKTRGVAQIAQEVEGKGGYINAYTSFEQTVYYINLPGENWQTAVDILADCMMNATIPAEELTKEKEVIVREMAMNEDDPDRRSNRLLWSTAYIEHPYRHPVIGYPDVFNRITRDDVVAYYRANYVPNNLVFAVVGDIDAEAVIARLRELTKDFKRAPVAPLYVPAEPPQLSARERHEEAPIQLSHINLAWHIPAVTHPDVYPLDVLAIIAGNGRSSRLYREVRQRKGLVHSIDCGAYTPRHPGIFGVEAEADPDKRDAAIQAIREEVERFRNEPVTDAELRKAIKTVVSSHLAKFQRMEGQASDMAHNYILTGDPNFSDTYLEKIRQVRAEDLRRVATQYFTNSNLTVTSLNPVTKAEAKPAATNAARAITIRKFTLPNGVRLLVREDPKLPFVDYRVLCKGGVIAETATDNGITKLTARMLLKGTATRTAEQIAESIESVGGDISYFAGNNSFGTYVRVMEEDAALGLEVLADVTLHPGFPREMLERERRVQLAEIKAEQDQVLRVGQQVLREAIYTKHPYRLNPLGSADTVSQLTPADLAAFHQRFVAPDNMVITVFGKVKADEVRRQIEKTFGGLKPTKTVFPNNGPETLKTVVSKTENRPKEQAVVLIGFSAASIYDPDRWALELLDEAYSGQGSRLFLRVRDELGLAYYVGAYQMPGLDPGYFAFYAGLQPEKVKTVEQEIFAELQKLRADGLSAAELERAKNSRIGQLKVQMQDNGNLSMTAGLDELYGLGAEFFQTLEAKYRAVTADDIRRVANKYLTDKAHATAVVTPPAK